MYIIAVKLSLNDSFKMRKLLNANGFIIYLLNSISGQLNLVQESYDIEGSEMLLYDTNNSLSYYCLYNETCLPAQKVFKRLEEDASVLEYNIVKR
ncbi:hypothetical protein IKG38_01775 [Candidatus Saccharibacteria bacterium]|nr:hypothetical protein [Candidatus Saccharibacteria bacterium]